MSLFKRKESSFEDMDSQGQLKRIMEQLGFLEKKIDSVLEELRNRGGSRPSFGGGQGGPRNFSRDSRDRGSFRGGSTNRPRSGGGNTRYGGNGPQRYNSARPFGSDDNRGNFGGGGGRPDGARNNHRNNNGPRRPHQNPNAAAPAAPPAPADGTRPGGFPGPGPRGWRQHQSFS